MVELQRTIKDWDRMLGPFLPKIAKETSFTCRPGLHEIFKNHPRLIVAINHATPLSWLPAMALLVAHSVHKGGGERVAVGVMDRFLFAIPGLREIARMITQSDQPKSFTELLSDFTTEAPRDIVLFPEGSNCFFGPSDQIQKFRSPRFVELAYRANVPILVCVHVGSESWATSVPVAPATLETLKFLPHSAREFLADRIKETGSVSIPLLPLPIAKFSMICELHTVNLPTELPLDRQAGRELLAVEAERIRMRMKELLDELEIRRVSKS